MAHELAAKLRLTMALLGCGSRKELGARFRAVNPRTAFDVERSHKWLQGRAKPRSGAVYEDWARVLGSDRPGSWLAACGLDAFLDELCAKFAADRGELMRRAGLGEGDRSGPGEAAVHYLCGRFAAYSHAWSPYFSGQLIRGALEILPGRGTRFRALYRESLPAGPIELRGGLSLVGRMLHAELRESGSGTPAYLTTYVPGRPANVLCGILSGATFMSPDPEPSASRIALIRVAPASTSALERASCYLRCDQATVARDLAALGIAAADPDAAAEALVRFLAPPPRSGMEQVGQADQARLSHVFDHAGMPER